MPTVVGTAILQVKANTDAFAASLGVAKQLAVSGARAIQSVFTSLRGALGTVGAALAEPFQAALSGLGAGAEIVGKVVGSVLGAGLDAASAAVTGVFGAVSSLASGIVGSVSGVLSGLSSAASGIASALTGNISGALSGAMGLVSGLASAVGSLLSGVLGAVTSLASACLNVAMSIVKGVTNIFQTLLETATSVAAKIIGIMGRMGASIVAPAMGAMGKSLLDFDHWIEGAMHAESAFARMNAILEGTGHAAGFTAAQMKIMAGNLKEASGGMLAGPDIAEAQTVLLRFRSVRGDQFAEALDAARQLAAILGEDLPAAARQLGMALENPEHGMRQLRHAGITLSSVEEQLIKQKHALGDVAGAEEILLGAVRRYGDVSGAMADTTEGRLAKLKATWNSIGQEIGKALLPLVNIVTEFIQPVIEGLAQTLRSFLGGVGESSKSLLEEARTWISENKDQFMQWGRLVGEIFTGLAHSVGSMFSLLGDTIAAAFRSGADAADVGATDMKDSVTNALATIAAATKNIPTVWEIVWDKIQIGWLKVTGHLKSLWPPIWDFIKDGFSAMSDLIWNNFLIKFEVVWNKIGQKIADNSGILGINMLKWKNDSFAEGAKEKIEEAQKKLENLRLRQRDAAEPDPEIKALEAEVKRLTAVMGINIEEEKRLTQRAPPGQEGGKKDLGPSTPAPYDNQQKAGFGFVGFGDMWKKIQESISPGTSMLGIAQQQKAIQERIAGGIDKVNENLQRRQPNDGGAVVAPG